MPADSVSDPTRATTALVDTQDMSRSLYGNESGEYAILEASTGFVPPPKVGSLRYIATTTDVFALIPRTIKQADIAAEFGVSQQAVSRWINGVVEPRLVEAQWRSVVRRYFRGLPNGN